MKLKNLEFTNICEHGDISLEKSYFCFTYNKQWPVPGSVAESHSAAIAPMPELLECDSLDVNRASRCFQKFRSTIGLFQYVV